MIESCLICGLPLTGDAFETVEVEIPADNPDLLLLLADRKELRICQRCADHDDDDGDEPAEPIDDPMNVECCGV